MQETSNFDIKIVLKTTMKNCKYYYNKEEGFRIDVVRAINQLYGDDAFVLCEYAMGNRKSIDIVVRYNKTFYAIELKYRAKRSKKQTQYEDSEYIGKYKITEPNNKYEYIIDVNKLHNIKKDLIEKNEFIKKEKLSVETYAILLSNIEKYNEPRKIVGSHEERILKKGEAAKIIEIEYDNPDINIIQSEEFEGFYHENAKDFYIVYIKK